ncbi:MAG TPA: CvpA family protein [Rubrivivax sp.]|nr:CvpA family protein [Rubrivivax sp.]
MDHLGWVDLAMLGVLVLSLGLGLWRGFVLEALALAGWVVAYFAAQWLAPQWAPRLPFGEPGSALNHGAAFAAAFLVVLIGWGLASRVLRLLVNATPLRGADRVLGAAFGLLRGVLLLLLVAAGVALTPAAASPEWHRSQGAQWLAVALQGIKPLLPPELAQHFRT